MPVTQPQPSADSGWNEIVQATHHDPFTVLGRHRESDAERIVVFLPQAATAAIENGPSLQRFADTDLFSAWLGGEAIPQHYRVIWQDHDANTHCEHDPYTFAPRISDYDLHLFGEGRHWHAYRMLGAMLDECDGVSGVTFATWAPNAQRVSVVGEFNQWDGRRYPMRSRGGSGIWELFVPGLGPDSLYKFEVLSSLGIELKTDPYGRAFELRPGTAAVVKDEQPYAWRDQDWLQGRESTDWQRSPLSVYEVHLGSWQRDGDGSFLGYRDLAHRLADYVGELGFTHVELLPITEHPLDASWGYQATGYFAPTSRHGSPDDFRYFVDYLHQHGIGVYVDWVPAHFPRDQHSLARFDGTALYEHEDPRRGEHRDWGTLIFNYGRKEVKNFLLASAVYWLEEFHIDGLRVDAVASMLYLDYSREEGDWEPNIHGGRENLEAIEFVKELNGVCQGQFPGTLVIAEESTAWPQVTRPSWLGGLGFSMKWNMGWMHDILLYMNKDPIHRHFHQDLLTFGVLYAFNENFMLPFSHDEVVHMKGSLLEKMPGDDWQKFANLRLLYTYMFTYPGKKLLFMGSEFAQRREWGYDGSLDWQLLERNHHRGVRTLIADLNQQYRAVAALHGNDFATDGFEWIDCHDASQSVLSYIRRDGDEFVIVVLNFTPVPRQGYRIGVPVGGGYREVLNSDSAFYGGTNVGNGGGLTARRVPWMGKPYSLDLTLPPLAGVVLQST